MPTERKRLWTTRGKPSVWSISPSNTTTKDAQTTLDYDFIQLDNNNIVRIITCTKNSLPRLSPARESTAERPGISEASTDKSGKDGTNSTSTGKVEQCTLMKYLTPRKSTLSPTNATNRRNIWIFGRCSILRRICKEKQLSRESSAIMISFSGRKNMKLTQVAN